MQDSIAFGRQEVSFIVVGDRKTPAEAKKFCEDLRQRYPYDLTFLSVDDQERYLRSYPELASHLPYDSIQRRNVGVLLGYERGADVIITIDDDNFLAESNFIRCHTLVGQNVQIDAYGSPGGWINVCDFLTEEHGFRFYHRGFPLGERSGNDRLNPQVSSLKGRVVVNVGFWLDEPDVDAVTRLALPARVTGLKRAENFALAFGTWSPFNSQNTALARDIVPSYFLSPLVGRYDDIWASYVIKAIADHMGDLITFGHPLVRQERNPHDYWVDLDKEKDGMQLTDRFCQYLRAINFTGATYADCYKEVIEGLWSAIENDGRLSPFARSYLSGYVRGMESWRATIARVTRNALTKAVAGHPHV
ncbi:hypothetical protein [Candidatus Methylomirabilis sp.]|uniref:hypothetical protein n=1 Tax=Candidatus Methylomirabilis sp. TaxID=2032687 RepID=UPI0030765A89